MAWQPRRRLLLQRLRPYRVRRNQERMCRQRELRQRRRLQEQQQLVQVREQLPAQEQALAQLLSCCRQPMTMRQQQRRVQEFYS
ncbi:MAG: hypothetical protein JWP47_84 [Polaromonas sp.]|jgi:hypothetical protein|nr:hypothetical protein [Polaromonas sp.]